MPLHTLGNLLSATSELKALQAHTRRIQELQNLYLRITPGGLASASRVTSCRAGTLYVATEDPAVAAKLKQLTPRMIAAFQKLGAQVNSVRIEVQMTGFANARHSPKATLPTRALEEFGSLAKRVKNDALKSALVRLVRRHGKS